MNCSIDDWNSIRIYNKLDIISLLRNVFADLNISLDLKTFSTFQRYVIKSKVKCLLDMFGPSFGLESLQMIN